MRQFRGLTKDGKWVYGWYYKHLPSEKSFIKYYESRMMVNEEVIPETVGQQVGRKDKDDEEIYKGDIIRAIDPIALERGEPSDYVGVVIWSDKSLAWILEDKNGKFIELLCRAEQGEIIGNVHQTEKQK